MLTIPHDHRSRRTLLWLWLRHRFGVEQVAGDEQREEEEVTDHLGCGSVCRLNEH